MSFLFFKNNNDKYPSLARALPMNEQVIIKPLLLVFSGVLILWMTAQIRITLFFTPVPITGQTFGVLILAAAYGSRLGVTTMLAYLFVGIAGASITTLCPNSGPHTPQLLHALKEQSGMTFSLRAFCRSWISHFLSIPASM